MSKVKDVEWSFKSPWELLPSDPEEARRLFEEVKEAPHDEVLKGALKDALIDSGTSEERANEVVKGAYFNGMMDIAVKKYVDSLYRSAALLGTSVSESFGLWTGTVVGATTQSVTSEVLQDVMKSLMSSPDWPVDEKGRRALRTVEPGKDLE